MAKGKGKGKGKGLGRGNRKGKGSSGVGAKLHRNNPEYDKFKGELLTLPQAPVSLTEAEVGIVAYMNETIKGFGGLFRERFSDFLVHEVSSDGQVAVLSSTNIPFEFDDANGFAEEIPNLKRLKENEQVSPPQSVEDGSSILPAVKEEENSVIDAADAERKQKFAAECWENVAAGVEEVFGGQVGQEARKSIENLRDDMSMAIRVLLPSSVDKTTRKTCHQLIHDHIGHLVDADTIDNPQFNEHSGTKTETKNDETASKRLKVETNGKCIRIWWRPVAGMKRKRMVGKSQGEKPRDYRSNTWQQRARHNWTSTCPSYVRFVLYKENMDTMTAIDRIANLLRIRSSDIGYAGTKDKRACTSQWCTFFKLPASKASSIVNAPFLESQGKLGRNLLIGNFSYTDSALDLGDLGGNRFGITLRRLFDTNKHIGLNHPDLEAMLTDHIRSACEAIKQSGFINFFGIQRFGSGGVSTADVGRAILADDWDAAVKLVLSPRGGDHEDAVLAKHVYNSSQDARLALGVMPHWMKGEYAVLSGLADGLSPRDSIRRIPHKLKLMYVHAYQSKLFNVAAGKRVELGAQPIEGDLVLIDTKEGGGGGGTLRRGQKGKQIHVVSDAEAENGVFSLSQVVLPLPGHGVNYPQYSVPSEGDSMFFDNLLAADGLAQNKLKRNDEFSLSGDYRALVGKVGDLQWSLQKYDVPEKVLLPSDGDKVNHTLRGGEEVIDNDVPGEELALCIEFTLPSSSYATVFLRELMKNSMCSSYHVSMGQASLVNDDQPASTPPPSEEAPALDSYDN